MALASAQNEISFKCKIPVGDDMKIFVGSVDIAMQFYPPKSDKTNIGLIVNVAKKFGNPIIDKSDKNCAVMYMVLSENSSIEQLYEICDSVFNPITQTLFNKKKHVIIHCNEGKIRSPTIAYLYLTLVLQRKHALANAYLKGSKYMNCIHGNKAKQYLCKLEQKYAISTDTT
eukprot:246935_1